MRAVVRIVGADVIQAWRTCRQNVCIAQDLENVIHAHADNDVLEHVDVGDLPVYSRMRPRRRACALHARHHRKPRAAVAPCGWRLSHDVTST